MASLAVPAAALAAIGWTLWRKCARRSCDRAAAEALGGLSPRRGTGQALQDREGRIANLKAAAEEAVRTLRLDEAKQLIRDAIAVPRSERTLQALHDDAALVETEAEIALLEGDADEAHRLLAAAADSFAPFDRIEAVKRRRHYLPKLYRHGRRYWEHRPCPCHRPRTV